jgi:hypothetical protein
VTDEDLEKTIRAALAAEAAEVEPAGTLADLRARIARTEGHPMTDALSSAHSDENTGIFVITKIAEIPSS